VKLKYYKICRVRCQCCEDVLEYINQSKTDRGPGAPMYCSCKRVGLDPSASLFRILGNAEDFEDLSEEWDDEPYDPNDTVTMEELMKEFGITQADLDEIDLDDDDIEIEPLEMAKYWWTEDGDPETVTVETVKTDKETLCYHCSAPIEAGADVVKLTASDGDIYILHPECAKKALFAERGMRMKRDSVNIKRFVRSLRYAMESLAGEAKCYRYEHDPEYTEIKEDLKFCLRELEEGEEFAGKLLFKNARNISHPTALNLIRQAKTEEERNFWAYVADMNMQRCQKEVIDKGLF